MKQTENINVLSFEPFITPRQLKHMVPLTAESSLVVSSGREEIINILYKKDPRFLIIVGPCSIHDPKGAIDYAGRLKKLSAQVSDRILIVMRVYFEKPRTTIGWKGLINDPNLDGTHDIEKGLRKAREILSQITAMGLPTASEMLDPITPQYLADLLCWGAIGARTTESQIHREMASGLSFPVGLKNGTDGSLQIALDAIKAGRNPHHFLGINEDGISSVVNTRGNPNLHIVLRGGAKGPNYETSFIQKTEKALEKAGLNSTIIIDCSHANSDKDHRKQEAVLENVITQREQGNRSILGVMIESYIHEGNQSIPDNLSDLSYGVSVTDKCIDWETTERMIKNAYEKLK